MGAFDHIPQPAPDAPCPLCVWQDPPIASEEDRRAVAYCAGYADGVKATLTGRGQPMCRRHSAIRDNLLVQRGLAPLRQAATREPLRATDDEPPADDEEPPG